MKIKISKITVIIVSVLILICLVLVVFIFFMQDFAQEREVSISESITRKLIVEPAELNMSMGDSVNLKAYLYNSDSNEKEDVTDKIEWTTNDSSIAVVGNKSIKGQVISRRIEGTTKIIASYNNQQIEVPVNVFRPELEVECIPRIMNEGKAEFRDTARIGETIHWVSNYPKLGVPHYIYEWSGTDELKSNYAVAKTTYNTIGVKTAKIFTVDMAGSTAESECSIIIIE